MNMNSGEECDRSQGICWNGGKATTDITIDRHAEQLITSRQLDQGWIYHIWRQMQNFKWVAVNGN